MPHNDQAAEQALAHIKKELLKAPTDCNDCRSTKNHVQDAEGRGHTAASIMQEVALSGRSHECKACNRIAGFSAPWLAKLAQR